MSQFKPENYQRLEEGNADSHEMQSIAAQQPTQTQPAQHVFQPPPYIGYAQPAPAAFQQSSNSNVVVATQPTAMPPVTVVDPHLKPKPIVMVVTIVLTVVCLVQQCWPVLVCLVPALIAAVVGFALSDSGSAEQRHTARAFHAVAVCCNVATVVYYVMVVIALIITLASVFGSQNSYNDYSYYSSCYSACNGNINCQNLC